MSSITLHGSCLCGAISYKATGEEKRFYHCHCSRCRKVTGTGHASNLFVKGALSWQSGEDLLTSYVPPGATRFRNRFCSICGSRMPRYDEGYGTVFIPAGSLDTVPSMQPEARIFFGSRTPWSCCGTGIPEYDEYRTRE
ncbi:MAG: GFA family protein [Xanthomonadales bacterium]|nr:GFA family protein [Gammaproteobacteria bacterium]NNL95356.1 GFA family protein [Xanthomonadales bacterium]